VNTTQSIGEGDLHLPNQQHLSKILSKETLNQQPRRREHRIISHSHLLRYLQGILVLQHSNDSHHRVLKSQKKLALKVITLVQLLALLFSFELRKGSNKILQPRFRSASMRIGLHSRLCSPSAMATIASSLPRT
jgi:hypothetical protein